MHDFQGDIEEFKECFGIKHHCHCVHNTRSLGLCDKNILFRVLGVEIKPCCCCNIVQETNVYRTVGKGIQKEDRPVRN